MRSNFTAAGLDIPISISELAFGWQSSGNITAISDSVDFFMINEFPYFAQNAQAGGSDSSWQNLLTDIDYFETLANGRPLLITQVSFRLSLGLSFGAESFSDGLAKQRGRVCAQQPRRRGQRRVRGGVLELA